jgi:hypothetical protein
MLTPVIRGPEASFTDWSSTGGGSLGRVPKPVGFFGPHNARLMFHRKAAANSRAVEERQILEKRTRDQKTGARALATLQNKHDGFDTRQTALFRDYETWKQESAEVLCLPYPASCY